MHYAINSLHQVYDGADHKLKGVADSAQIKQQQTRSNLVADVVQADKPDTPSAGSQDKSRRRPAVEQDRRKVNHRIMRQPVPFEFRVGADRRHRNQREGDIVEHISVIA